MEDLLSGIKEEDLPGPKEKGLFHKILVMALGLFMIFLFLSYFLVGPNTMSIIAGMFGSDVIDEGSLVVVKDEVAIAFSLEVYNELKQMYLDNVAHEFKACLQGELQGSSYTVDTVFVPVMFEQAFDHVVAEPCPVGTLIDFHSHPEKHCTPSYHDVQLLKRLKASDPDIIMAVMCGLDRFTFYT